MCHLRCSSTDTEWYKLRILLLSLPQQLLHLPLALRVLIAVLLPLSVCAGLAMLCLSGVSRYDEKPEVVTGWIAREMYDGVDHGLLCDKLKCTIATRIRGSIGARDRVRGHACACGTA